MPGAATAADLRHLPYWRLSGFYFFYFALLGILVPYWSLYLQALDFSSRQIGVLGAVLMLTRVVAPNVWGWLSDRSGRRLTVIRVGAGLACIAFAQLFWRQDFLWLCLVVASFSFFWNAILAQFEVITLAHLGGHSHYYSRLRLWGSVGFIVLAVSLGLVFQRYSILALPWVILGVLTAIWLSSLLVPGVAQPAGERTHGDGLRQRLRHPAVISFLLAAFLLQFSHGAYYTFYSIYLEQHGYPRSLIGGLWGLGVVAEVAVFWFMHHLLQRFGPRPIMLATLALTVLRWLIIGVAVDSLVLILLAQLLHAFSFGTAHAVSIELVRRFFHGRCQGQGQALLSAVSFGAGGALGALASGWIWSSSPTATFLVSAAAALLALGVVWRGLRGESVALSYAIPEQPGRPD